MTIVVEPYKAGFQASRGTAVFAHGAEIPKLHVASTITLGNEERVRTPTMLHTDKLPAVPTRATAAGGKLRV